MKYLFVVFGLFIHSIAFCQSEYDTYFMSFTSGEEKEFKIEVGENKGVLEELYIHALSVDDTYSKVVLMIKSKDVKSFSEYLIDVKDKFIEWSDTAIKNDIKDFSKEIDINHKTRYMAAFGYNDWHVDRRVGISSLFIVEDGVPSLWVHTGKLYDQLNRYITSKGMVIKFNDGEEIDLFLSKIDINKINNHIKGEGDVSGLFK